MTVGTRSRRKRSCAAPTRQSGWYGSPPTGSPISTMVMPSSDENVCRASARPLFRFGLGAEARELVATTASALDSLGLDGDAFRRREVARLHASDRGNSS